MNSKSKYAILSTARGSLLTRLVCYLAAIALSFANLSAQETGTKPENYDEIKSLLETFARAHDFLDPKMHDAMKTLHSKGDAAIPALLILFEENTDDLYRSSLVASIWNNKGSQKSKKAAADFLVKQLESLDVEKWENINWISNTIGFLPEADMEQARAIAWKALNSSGFFIKECALNALKQAGTPEDAIRLKDWISQGKLPHRQASAEEAINRITMRAEKPQAYKDAKAMLDSLGLYDDEIRQNYMSEELLNAWETLRFKGKDPVHVLTFLFEQNPDDSRRSDIVSTMNYRGTPEGRKVATAFLTKQLEVDVGKWKGKGWIEETMKLLRDADPEQARRVSRKALNSHDERIRNAAIFSLQEVGTAEDVEALNSFIRQSNNPDDSISKRAEKAVERITERTKGKKSKPDDEK